MPEQIVDFIRTHHGTTRLQYFYQTFLKNFPDEILDETLFRYPGPLPYSKETAVLMMADSVEASSRSLQHADAETIDHLVEQIINNQISQNQFINSPKGFVPGTAMGFAGIQKDSERADVIDYLHTLSDNPQPLPTAAK